MAEITSPPYSLDITLDALTVVDSPTGITQPNPWFMLPGRKILLINLPDVIARDLSDPTHAAYIDVREVQLDYAKG